MDDVVGLLIDGLLGNPFATDPELMRWAEEAFDEVDRSRLVSEVAGRDDAALLEKLVLAFAHREARRRPDDPRSVLQPQTLPSRLSTRLPRPRTDYLRIAMAAGRSHTALNSLLGGSPAMQRVRRQLWATCFGQSLYHLLHLERVVRDDDLLILGETGTGKEAAAAAVQLSTPGGRDGGPAPATSINAAALPATLVESELFGYVNGAFTGANDTRSGRIRSADGGCFFLDEVGDLPAHTQVKMLRVIESDELAPLGSDVNHHVDVRFVAATHRDLEAMVEADEFRRDLYQRLAGNVIHLPPLRERPEDIEAIGAAFIRKYLPEGVLDELAGEVLRWLRSPRVRAYHWPGNVRELQNVIRSRLVGLEPELHTGMKAEAGGEALPTPVKDCVASLEDVEVWYLRRVIAATNGNLAQTARILGVDRSTVRRRLKQAGSDA
jgi:transcriptional regulator with PAS, ATPase and Fis domain